MILPVVESCGSCTVCCTVMGVQELGKPYYHRCQHQNLSGCKIYGNHPDSCKQYTCMYRLGMGGGDVSYRPDRFGFLFGAGIEEERFNLHVNCAKPLSQISVDNCREMVRLMRVCRVLGLKKGMPFTWTKFSTHNSEIGCEFKLKDPYPKFTEMTGNQFIRDLLEPTFLIHIPLKIKDNQTAILAHANTVMLKVFGRKYIPHPGDNDGDELSRIQSANPDNSPVSDVRSGSDPT